MVDWSSCAASLHTTKISVQLQNSCPWIAASVNNQPLLTTIAMETLMRILGKVDCVRAVNEIECILHLTRSVIAAHVADLI